MQTPWLPMKRMRSQGVELGTTEHKSSLVKDLIPGKLAISAQKASAVILYLPCVFDKSPHFFPFIYSSHTNDLNISAFTYVINTSVIFISPTFEKAYYHIIHKQQINFYCLIIRSSNIWFSAYIHSRSAINFFSF